MDIELADLSEKILDVLSQSEGRYLMVVYPDKDLCHWTDCSLSCFDLDGKNVKFSYLWDSLLHPDDRERFRAECGRLLGGSGRRISEKYRFRRRDGSYQSYQYDLWMVSSSVPVCLAGMLADPAGARSMDPITALPSNYDFQRTLGNYISQNRECTVMAIGIDNFKLFNEMYSYAFGNRVICLCADIVREMLPERTLLFRSDGDGFNILFAGEPAGGISEWFRQVQYAIQQPKEIDGLSICFTISAGICRSKSAVPDEDLYQNAVLALQSAKANGKNQLVRYSNILRAQMGSQAKLLACLRESIALGFKGFQLYYQPLVHSQDGSLAGCEALLRWEHPSFPDMPIQTCVACLEENGLINEVGKWILETSVKQCAKWVSYIPDFCMNINISCQQFENSEFKFAVLYILNEYGVNPENIMLELTESGRVKNADRVGDVFNFLRSQRLRISFDDFGTGYASLDIFRKLSADELKIDRSFLERITYDVTDQALITTLISLCHNMNMLVCVEGIESQEMETIIRQMKPDYLQGFYYSCPLTAENFEKKYFSGREAVKPAAAADIPPEQKNSMTYSAFRPAQPLGMADIINHAYAGIFQVGMDKVFSFQTCNEGYRRMLGYTAAEIEKKFKNQALGFVHPDDITYVNEEIRRQLGEGDTVTIEFRIVRKDHTPIWIMGTGNVYRSPDGSCSLIVVIINNDKAKRLQLERLQKYEMYKKLLKNLPTGIKLVRYDPDFTIDYISPGFLNVIGYTEEDIKTLFDGKYINLIYPEDREAVFNDIMEQLQKSDVVTMHYRTPCKDGSLLRVETVSRLCPADEDGIQRACSSVVDISKISSSKPKERNRGLNIANRYISAASRWGEFLFELNFKTDTISLSENFNQLFGIEPQWPLSAAIELIYPEDRGKLAEVVALCRKGETPEPAELRLQMPDGTDRWFSAAFSEPEKFGEIPVSVLGKLTDIDKARREKEILVRQAQYDPLTGLLNKSSTENSVRKQLAENPGARFAMFMMDVDGFKDINDTLGHFSGDGVLQSLAESLRSQFRQGDIVGRVGGDEFMAFISCGEDDAVLIEKAQNILTSVCREVYVEDGPAVRLTVSIGISRCPENGTEFYSLFRLADSALYRAKELGRNRYCISSKA